MLQLLSSWIIDIQIWTNTILFQSKIKPQTVRNISLTEMNALWYHLPVLLNAMFFLYSTI